VPVANVQRSLNRKKKSHSEARDASMRETCSQSSQVDGHDIWPVIWLAAVGAFSQPVGKTCLCAFFAEDMVAGPEHGILGIQLADRTKSDLL
jgi:hypothetical protein